MNLKCRVRKANPPFFLLGERAAAKKRGGGSVPYTTLTEFVASTRAISRDARDLTSLLHHHGSISTSTTSNVTVPVVVD